MRSELAADLYVLPSFIGHQRGVASDIGANDRRNLSDAGGVDMEAASFPTAFDKGQNDILMCETRGPWVPSLGPLGSGLID